MFVRRTRLGLLFKEEERNVSLEALSPYDAGRQLTRARLHLLGLRVPKAASGDDAVVEGAASLSRERGRCGAVDGARGAFFSGVDCRLFVLSGRRRVLSKDARTERSPIVERRERGREREREGRREELTTLNAASRAVGVLCVLMYVLFCGRAKVGTEAFL